MTDIFMLFLLGVACLIGVAIGEEIENRAAKRKLLCPWEPCGYPLPKAPLYSKVDRYTNEYAPETCPGCNNKVCYNEAASGYVRLNS